MNLIFTKCAQLTVGRDSSRHGSVGMNPDLQLWLPRIANTFLLAMFCANVHAEPQAEYEVKAAFVHNMAKFVEWPAVSHAGGKLQLCILGQSPFTKASGALEGERIDGLVWEVQQVDSRSALQACRVLFIAASESGNLRRVLQGIEGRAVLTVGDSGGYAEQGVMVNFYMGENKVRFEINREAARRAGLKISPQLLKLARIVPDARGIK